MLKIGDKIRVVIDVDNEDIIGEIGIIKRISDEDSYGDRKISVEFKRYPNHLYSFYCGNYGDALEKVEELDNVANIDDMNVYECIAYKLGLEIDEEFIIGDGNGFVYKMSKDGLKSRYKHSDVFEDSTIMFKVLENPDKLIKLSDLVWKPKVNEDYYYINDLLQVVETHNEDLSIDSYYFKAGNFFKTKEETEDKIVEIKKLLNKR